MTLTCWLAFLVTIAAGERIAGTNVFLSSTPSRDRNGGMAVQDGKAPTERPEKFSKETEGKGLRGGKEVLRDCTTELNEANNSPALNLSNCTLPVGRRENLSSAIFHNPAFNDSSRGKVSKEECASKRNQTSIMNEEELGIGLGDNLKRSLCKIIKVCPQESSLATYVLLIVAAVFVLIAFAITPKCARLRRPPLNIRKWESANSVESVSERPCKHILRVRSKASISRHSRENKSDSPSTGNSCTTVIEIEDGEDEDLEKNSKNQSSDCIDSSPSPDVWSPQNLFLVPQDNKNYFMEIRPLCDVEKCQHHEACDITSFRRCLSKFIEEVIERKEISQEKGLWDSEISLILGDDFSQRSALTVDPQTGNRLKLSITKVEEAERNLFRKISSLSASGCTCIKPNTLFQEALATIDRKYRMKLSYIPCDPELSSIGQSNSRGVSRLQIGMISTTRLYVKSEPAMTYSYLLKYSAKLSNRCRLPAKPIFCSQSLRELRKNSFYPLKKSKNFMDLSHIDEERIKKIFKNFNVMQRMHFKRRYLKARRINRNKAHSLIWRVEIKEPTASHKDQFNKDVQTSPYPEQPRYIIGPIGKKDVVPPSPPDDKGEKEIYQENQARLISSAESQDLVFGPQKKESTMFGSLVSLINSASLFTDNLSLFTALKIFEMEEKEEMLRLLGNYERDSQPTPS